MSARQLIRIARLAAQPWSQDHAPSMGAAFTRVYAHELGSRKGEAWSRA